MQLYVSRNNQQIGPLEEAKVLEMLKTGQLSANDMAIRQGEKEWQKLGSLYPPIENRMNPAVQAAVPPAPAAVNPVAVPAAAVVPAAKKSRTGLLLGCGGFLVLGFLIAAGAGLFAYRNMNPSSSADALPTMIKPSTFPELKLTTSYPPKGNFWGTETSYIGMYQDDAKSYSVVCSMTSYADGAAALKAQQDDSEKKCQGSDVMKFTFIDDNKKEASQGATCGYPLYVRKDNNLYIIGGPGTSVSLWTEFAEALPFNKGTTMKKQ